MKLPGHLVLSPDSVSSERSQNYQFHFISLQREDMVAVSQYIAIEVERGSSGEK